MVAAASGTNLCDWKLAIILALERIGVMALFRVKPTSVDEDLANEIASRASPVPEEVAGELSWGADEHLLLGCAAAAWIALTISRSPLRPASSHLLLIAAASAALPHGLKLVFDQVRPDRKTLGGHLHGIPLSGDSLDAFPSGHAVHMGALASAASVLPPRYRSGVLQLACPRRELRFKLTGSLTLLSVSRSALFWSAPPVSSPATRIHTSVMLSRGGREP